MSADGFDLKPSTAPKSADERAAILKSNLCFGRLFTEDGKSRIVGDVDYDSAAQRLLKLVNALLDFSRIEAGGVEVAQVDFVLRAVVEDILELLAPRAHEKKLDALIASGGARGGAAQQPGAQRAPRPEPDRSKTYAVSVENDPFEGPADAKITLIEAFDQDIGLFNDTLVVGTLLNTQGSQGFALAKSPVNELVDAGDRPGRLHRSGGGS